MIILAGDVGGTKTHLALFDSSEKKKWIKDEKYKSAQYPNLTAIIREFLSKYPAEVACACFGVPGAVVNGTCRVTNLPWVIESKKVAEETAIKQVFLINDLEANSYGINCLSSKELFPLNHVKETHQGNAAIISAGTGLGEAALFWNGKKHIPFASEGGHCSFAPQNELEMDLLRYLRKEFAHVSYERILSGKGLYRLYRFFIDCDLEIEKEEVKQAIASQDPAKVITEMAMQDKCQACKRALHLFVSVYGSEAGNLALKMLAIGGVYVGGGIAPKILGALKEGEFITSFSAKGRFHGFLANIPVKIVLNEHTALLGATAYARENSL